MDIHQAAVKYHCYQYSVIWSLSTKYLCLLVLCHYLLWGCWILCHLFLSFLKLKFHTSCSDSGYLGRIEGNDSNSVKLRAKLATSDSTLTVDELSKLMTDFIQATEAGNWKEIGWPDSAYLVSKIGLCTLSRIQQREFNKDPRKVFILAKNMFLLFFQVLSCLARSC